MKKTEGFEKDERMVSQKLIGELFNGDQSHSLVAFPLRAVYQVLPSTLAGATSAQVQTLISVPKRKLHHAVDRNRVKRQIREAYRRRKQLVTGKVDAGSRLAVAFVWLSDQLAPSAVVDRRMDHLLNRLASRL